MIPARLADLSDSQKQHISDKLYESPHATNCPEVLIKTFPKLIAA